MKTILRIIVGILGACAWFANEPTAQPSLSTPAVVYAQPDAKQLRPGRFTYRTLNHSKPVGKGRTSIRRLESGSYEISADFAFFADFEGYPSQRWTSIAAPDLAPISATLAFGEADARAPIFDLHYAAGRVTGFLVSRKGSEAGTRRAIDAALPDHTYDQRIDWAAVLASDLQAGQSFEFNVYDPGTGISRVTARVDSVVRVEVPAGSFDAWRVTYRIEKAGGTEEYRILASRDLPRILVREEFPDGSVDELVEMTNGGDAR